MTTEQLRELELVIRNPESVAETPQEMADRLQCQQLFSNSNSMLNRGVDTYEAGWKAAKAYYEAQR